MLNRAFLEELETENTRGYFIPSDYELEKQHLVDTICDYNNKLNSL